MLAGTLDVLKSIDPAVLAEAVRQAQRDPTFEIDEWSVQSLSHEKIIDTTGGLFVFSGTGRGGQETTPWAIVMAGWAQLTDLLMERAEEARVDSSASHRIKGPLCRHGAHPEAERYKAGVGGARCLEYAR